MNSTGMISDRKVSILEVLLIVGFSLFPIILTFPYRVNIFLSWEGAYRMSQGQIPFRDFGIPLGYMFWVIPAFFFKLFGPSLVTLVKAQAFLNIVSALSFRAILKNFSVPSPVRLVCVIVFLLSYSFINFWPWYNHSVIVYEFLSLAFLTRFILKKRKIIWVFLAGFFSFVSFFTKQDAGMLCILFSLTLLIFDFTITRERKPLIIYLAMVVLIAGLTIYPLLSYQFVYWFNLGQPPHSSRFDFYDLWEDIWLRSQALKLSFLLVVVAATLTWYYGSLFKNRVKLFHLIFTLGILFQATILQVTSYTPPDNNIYFQAFTFTYLFTVVAAYTPELWIKPIPILGMIIVVFFWKSDIYGNYLSRLLQYGKSGNSSVSESGENLVNRSNYLLTPKGDEIPEYMWKEGGPGIFRNIRMPEPTIRGMERLLSIDVMKKKGVKVLNMSELTPLAAAVPFELEKGSDQPLWYHLGVGMFNREAKMIEKRIVSKYYDVVLFEFTPGLNNFFPFRVRDSLKVHYKKVDSFYAPRRGPQVKGTMVEVYLQ